MHRLQELVRLHRMGLAERRVAKELRTGRNTVRQYRRAIAAAELLEGSVDELPALEQLKAAVLTTLPPRPSLHQVSTMEAWQAQVEALLERGLGPQSIHDRLRLEHPDFRGSLGSLKRLVRRIRQERGVKPENLAIPVDTEDGEVAQVDFGYADHVSRVVSFMRARRCTTVGTRWKNGLYAADTQVTGRASARLLDCLR
jgi:hypothetical protein